MHEGVAETLNLPKPEEHAPVADTPALATASRSASSSGGKASSIPPGYIPPQMSGGAVDWNKAAKQLAMDPAKLAQQMHIEPVFENGKISGARLSGGGEVGALMNRAGLSPADVVTAVNGKSLTSLSDPQSFMDNLKNSTSLQVTVLRDGKPATLTVNLH
jgi:type II secretion system protein C